MAQMIKNLLIMQEPGFDPWVRKIPWKREWQPTPVFLPGEFHGQRSLVDYSAWSLKEVDTTEWLTLPTFLGLERKKNPLGIWANFPLNKGKLYHHYTFWQQWFTPENKEDTLNITKRGIVKIRTLYPAKLFINQVEIFLSIQNSKI